MARQRLLGLTALLAMAFVAACGGSDEADTAAANGPVSVSVQDARTETLRDVFVASGIVVPSASTDWSVTASEPARIAELPKNEGDAVETGDVLVRLEIPTLNDEIAAAD